MSMLQRWRPLLVVCSALLAVGTSLGAQTDLDAFMKQVLARRDENWKKLQQYVLDERETIDMQGPGHTQLWGERRDYTWYVRDGFFVRSPVKVNGVTISDAERRKYETDYLHRQQRRDRRRGPNGPEANAAPAGTTEAPVAQAPAPEAPPAGDVESLLRQTREPEFISSAYFLRFRFEEGKYALVGRETLDGIETLRIEYYPTNLFRGTDRRRNERANERDSKPDDKDKAQDKAYDAEFRRLMNKTALVTLWVEPKAHQIVKYTFDNIALDFLPAQWLVQLDELHASMTMGQPFPDVWLPSGLEFHFGATFAIGPVDLRYTLQYHDYRRADVTSKVTVPKDR